MVTDRQVKRLFGLLSGGTSLSEAALKTGMSEKTARRYRMLSRLPSELKKEHTWRTRKDLFEAVWPEVEEQLRVNPGLQANTLFDWLQRRYEGKFQSGQLRTLQRRMKVWRATEGPAKEVFFGQVHHPGDLCASDFTHMSRVGVTIAGQPFDHMVYHFVLTYSNWEAVTICFSESYQTLSEGLQNALWKLGGVPRRHRTDRLSAAVNNLDEERDFTDRYKALMHHYDLVMEKIQAGHANENGDVESSHGGLKTAVDQALMLRGHRDFESRGAYADFLQEVADQRNSARQKRLAEELEVLRSLPERRLASFTKERVRVNTGSLIHVQRNTYSVHSRLIGEKVDVRIHADELEIWYAQRCVDRMPRLRGRGKHRIQYRHIIDWLVRKPGAFENYRYREDLYPTSRFRMAYDALRDQRSREAAVKDYLEILRLAAYESEARVDEALRVLLSEEATWTVETVRDWVLGVAEAPSVTDVQIPEPDLFAFDSLLTNMEVFDGCQHGCEIDAHGSTAGIASASVP